MEEITKTQKNIKRESTLSSLRLKEIKMMYVVRKFNVNIQNQGFKYIYKSRDINLTRYIGGNKGQVNHRYIDFFKQNGI